MDVGFGSLADFAVDCRHEMQVARAVRSFRRDHDRAMAGGDERAVEMGKDLFGAAGRIGRHGCERVADAQHRQHRAASSRHLAEVSVQPKPS